MKKKAIATSFLAYSVAALWVVIGVATAFLLVNMKSREEAQLTEEVKVREESLRQKGELISGFLSSILFQPVVTGDDFTIHSYADALLADPEISEVHVDNAAGKEVIHKLAEGVTDTVGLKTFIKPIAFSGAPAVGNLTLGLTDGAIRAAETQSREALKANMRKLLIFSVIIAVLMTILIGGILMVVLRRVVLSPLVILSNQMKDISEGEGDLTKRINLTISNEMGVLSRFFDAFLDKLQAIVRKLTDQSGTLASASGRLQDNSTQLANSTGKVAAQAEAVSASAKEATEKVRGVSQSVEGIFDAVGVINNSLAQINSTLTEVSHNCQKESEISASANTKAQETKGLVRRLDQDAEDIGNVLEVISDIADKTNLLALNAAIEAASAGEAGRSFAVVAGEVKELASQTGQATQEISKTISNIRANSAASVKAIEEIAEIIEEVSSIAGIIAAAVEEQSAMVNEVSNNLSSVNASSQSMNDNLKGTAQWIEDVSGSFVDVAQLAGSASQAVQSNQTDITRLNELAADLKSILGTFKV
jgi:methyl-accepting chemotaxis protein